MNPNWLGEAAMTELISPEMLRQNKLLHGNKKDKFGGSGHKQADRVFEFIKEIGARDMLDYGCGKCTLRKQLKKMRAKVAIHEYDPAVKGRDARPVGPFDLVVSTDVMEHVEPEFVQNVLKDIYHFARRGVYLAIATRPANKILPNGNNAHLIIEGADWWHKQIEKVGWTILRMQDVRKGGTPDGPNHEVRFWLKPVK